MLSNRLKQYWKSNKMAFLFPVVWLLIQFLSCFPEFIEHYYSRGFYPLFSGLLRSAFGLIPFSVGDVIYTIFGIIVLYKIVKSFRRIKGKLLYYFSKSIGVLTVIYFLFYSFWALNYHRVRLKDDLDFHHEYNSHELYIFTIQLIKHTNALHLDITSNPDQKVVVPYSESELFDYAFQSYNEVGKLKSTWQLKEQSIKPSLYSTALSYMGFSGYLNPFTNEAQVNDKVPQYSKGATACHELAHQLGYASESEANFIGYLAAINSKDKYLEYSGYTLALRYCLRNVYLFDASMYEEMLKKVNPGILSNLEESKQFSQKYSTIIENVFEFFYDNFLKFNSQKDGMEGYNKFLDLLIGFYENREFGRVKEL